MGVARGKLTARIFHITVNKYLNSPNDRLFGPSILYREAMRTGQVPFRDIFSFEPLPYFKSSLHSSLSLLCSIIVWHIFVWHYYSHIPSAYTTQWEAPILTRVTLTYLILASFPSVALIYIGLVVALLAIATSRYSDVFHIASIEYKTCCPS